MQTMQDIQADEVLEGEDIYARNIRFHVVCAVTGHRIVEFLGVRYLGTDQEGEVGTLVLDRDRMVGVIR